MPHGPLFTYCHEDPDVSILRCNKEIGYAAYF